MGMGYSKRAHQEKFGIIFRCDSISNTYPDAYVAHSVTQSHIKMLSLLVSLDPHRVLLDNRKLNIFAKV